MTLVGTHHSLIGWPLVVSQSLQLFFTSKVRMLFARLQLFGFYSPLLFDSSRMCAHPVYTWQSRTCGARSNARLYVSCVTLYIWYYLSIKQRCSISTDADYVELIRLGNHIHFPTTSANSTDLVHCILTTRVHCAEGLHFSAFLLKYIVA